MHSQSVLLLEKLKIVACISPISMPLYLFNFIFFPSRNLPLYVSSYCWYSNVSTKHRNYFHLWVVGSSIISSDLVSPPLLTYTLSLSLSLSLTHTHTHTHTHTLSLSHTQAHTYTLSLPSDLSVSQF